MRFLPKVLAAASVSLTTAVATVLPAAAQDVTPARAGGADRYATAATAMTEVAHPTGTGTAVLATGEEFPDALAAAGLVGQTDAAMLLTQHDTLPTATADALSDLGVDNVYLMGGGNAVARTVARQLRDRGYDVGRVRGRDRYATAAAAAREVFRLGPTAQVDGQPAAFLATGEDYADAVTAGAPAAAGEAAPVLLTQHGTLPQVTREVISDLGIGHVWVVGGQAAVGRAVARQLREMDVEVERLAGRSRQRTAVAVARTFVNSPTLAGDTVTLAGGMAFPDALVGGVTAAATGGPVLLTDSATELGAAAEDYLANPPAAVSVVRAMGGPVALRRSVLERAVAVAESGSTAPQAWTLAPQQPVNPSPGETTQFTLFAPQDGSLPPQLHVALYDCTVTDPTGEPVFQDGNDDGLADGYATTENDSAVITAVNGSDIADTTAVAVGVPAGRRAHLHSDQRRRRLRRTRGVRGHRRERPARRRRAGPAERAVQRRPGALGLSGRLAARTTHGSSRSASVPVPGGRSPVPRVGQ